MNNMALLDAESIEKEYLDGTRALRGVSFSINQGEFVAIMGPSGSGKSTLLHVLGFLDRQSGGIYRFNGKTIDDYTKEEVAHVRNKEMGFVFQTFNLLPRTNVLSNVILPLMYSQVPESEWENRARKAIDSVGLSHRLDHEPSELSGGERQRVAIARALINNPQIIFADEPTGNLDSKSGEVILGILQDLHEDGKTIILITHETYLSEHAERIIHIKDGCIDSDENVNERRRINHVKQSYDF